MDEHIGDAHKTTAPRPRKKRTKMQIFKEAYLPALIVLAALILVITFIAGAVSRSVANRKAAIEESKAAAASLAQLKAEESAQVQKLLADAELLAAGYDYQGAMAVLDSFTGDASEYPALAAKKASYEDALKQLQIYNDPTAVPNLSFQMLIADPERAFHDDVYGSAYNRNYVTTDEFSKILQQLYDNGYMLVKMHDLVNTTVDADGKTVYEAATLALPAGKKPIILTQTAANYFTYMTDGDGDGLPDAAGDGFPYRLSVDENGKFVSEMIDSAGNILKGSYDFVTLLEDFIAEHPDFSYAGARAVLAVTGYDGVFGYRTDSGTKDAMGETYYDMEVAGAMKTVTALQAQGYELASYSYENMSYGEADFGTMDYDLQAWKTEVAPILGNADIFVFPYGDDLNDQMKEAYSGDKYQAMYDAGFRFFVGMNHDVPAEGYLASDYLRQSRRLVSGSRMAYQAEVFADLFDAKTVLNQQRGEVPE